MGKINHNRNAICRRTATLALALALLLLPGTVAASSLDYTNAWYGSVDGDGGMLAPGSQNWSAEKRADGQIKVTLRGHADYQPSVVLTVMSNDLTSYGTGPKVFITVSDMGQDSDGNWYFGAVTRNENGLKAQSFSFAAFATNNNQR